MYEIPKETIKALENELKTHPAHGTRFNSMQEAEDFYFTNLAQNNEDFAGLERWLSREDVIVEE